jgi:hypothetical protein
MAEGCGARAVMTGPDEAMLAPAKALAAFMATLDDKHLDGLFADDVTIVENFAPYIFRDMARWRDGFRAHAVGLSGLKSRFGTPQDFSRDGDNAYFVLPTAWEGLAKGRAFEEVGGWSFVLTKRNDLWTIAGYAWAVTAFRFRETRDG